MDSQDYFLCGADEGVAKSNFTPFAGKRYFAREAIKNFNKY